MKRAAFFLEGKTECIFIEKLILSIAGSRKLIIQKAEGLGGKKYPRQISFSDTNGTQPANYYFLIVDSRGDGRVISDLIEQYQGLVNKGYTLLLSCRDVAPDFTLAELPRFRSTTEKTLERYLGKKHLAIPIFAVMETEAWFLPEYSDFTKLKTPLDREHLLKSFGIDQIGGDLQTLNRPSKDLQNIHSSVKLRYRKKEYEVNRIMNLIDFSKLLGGGHKRFSDLEKLVDTISGFF